MLEEQTTPNDRKDGVILVAFGGGGPGGVEGLGSSFVLEVESSCESDMVDLFMYACIICVVCIITY